VLLLNLQCVLNLFLYTIAKVFFSIEYPSAISSAIVVDEKKSVVAKHKAKGKVESKSKLKDKMKLSLLDNPVMGTQSKKSKATSLAMSSRSKRRLSL
jgi:hypothetical protein